MNLISRLLLLSFTCIGASEAQTDGKESVDKNEQQKLVLLNQQSTSLEKKSHIIFSYLKRMIVKRYYDLNILTCPALYCQMLQVEDFQKNWDLFEERFNKDIANNQSCTIVIYNSVDNRVNVIRYIYTQFGVIPYVTTESRISCTKKIAYVLKSKEDLAKLKNIYLSQCGNMISKSLSLVLADSISAKIDFIIERRPSDINIYLNSQITRAHYSYVWKSVSLGMIACGIGLLSRNHSYLQYGSVISAFTCFLHATWSYWSIAQARGLLEEHIKTCENAVIL